MSTYVNAVYTGYLLEVNVCLMLEVSQLFGTVVTGLVWRLPCGFKIGRFYGWKRKPPGKFYINIFSDHPCLQIWYINSPNWLRVYLKCIIFGEIDMLMCNIHNFGALDSQMAEKKRVSRTYTNKYYSCAAGNGKTAISQYSPVIKNGLLEKKHI